MSSIGYRLKKERSRLHLNQADFALIGGVTRKSQSLYEKDERNPDAIYLSAIATAGADITYILTSKNKSTHETHEPIDINLIQLAIEAVETALYESENTMSSEKKAELITAIYDLYYESDAKPEKSKILRLVNLAA
ncbi:MAG: helix-turn-helix transcriptional regulator [Ghiorsea sp.]|nr:helix-turn-helix transcriptional regulator [Ghiorsea sp.]